MTTASYRLASADFTFPLLEHDKVLDLIAALDLDGIDVGLFEGRSHLWPSREFEQLSASAETLRKKLNDRGLAPADRIGVHRAPGVVIFAEPDTFNR